MTNFLLLNSGAYEIDPKIKIADSLFYAENFSKAESIYKDILNTAQGMIEGFVLKDSVILLFLLGT